MSFLLIFGTESGFGHILLQIFPHIHSVGILIVYKYPTGVDLRQRIDLFWLYNTAIDVGIAQVRVPVMITVI